MFEMIRLIFCRMPLQNSVMLKLKTKNRNHIKLFLHHWSEKYTIYKSSDIVSISTLSALINIKLPWAVRGIIDVLYVYCYKSVGSYKHKLSRTES